MSAFVHTILSKIDNPLIFKFIKEKTHKHQVKLLNGLRVIDSKER